MNKIIPIKLNREFKRLYRRGRSFVTPALVSYAQKNKLGFNRVGITTSTKIGCAVKRNRARRVIREAYRALSASIPAGWDFVFVARTRTGEVKTDEVISAMRACLERTGVL